jgi:hypothetical protein
MLVRLMKPVASRLRGRKAMSNKGIKQKPSHAQIERWLKSQEVRLGIANAGIQAIKPTVTKTTIRVILVESESARLSRAHQGADATISPGDLRYDMPPLSDMLPGILKTEDTPRRAKSKGVNDSFSPSRRAGMVKGWGGETPPHAGMAATRKSGSASRVRRIPQNDGTMNKPSSVDEIFDVGMDHLRRDLTRDGCPEFVIAKTVARQRRDFEWSKRALQKVLQAAD